MTQTEFICVPAIRGVQQHRQFYTVMLRLNEAASLCVTKDSLEKDLPVEYRTQRKLSALRASKLFQYLLDAAITKSDYVLPSLTCTIDRIEFEGRDTVGVIKVPKGSPWYLADGQHRIEAIKRLRAVYYKGVLGKQKLGKNDKYNLEWMLNQHVPVTVFHEAGYVKAQQIFADINKHSSKPDKELLSLFDHRSKQS
jgi:DGQHR domain-containing protein